jgi:hypothetical protein
MDSAGGERMNWLADTATVADVLAELPPRPPDSWNDHECPICSMGDICREAARELLSDALAELPEDKRNIDCLARYTRRYDKWQCGVTGLADSYLEELEECEVNA